MPGSTARRGSAQPIEESVLATMSVLVGIAAKSLAEFSDDVTLAQQRVLVLLAGTATQTMGQLAEQLGVNPSTATRICVRLEDKKLIRRRTDAADRRTVRVQLSARGRRLIEHVIDRRRAMIVEILADMSPPARRRLANSLAEFQEAAGDVVQRAWTLGWHVDDPDALNA